MDAKKAHTTGKILKTHHKIILFLVFLLLITMALLPLLINPIAESLIKKQAADLFQDRLTIGSVKVSFWTGTAIYVNGVDLAQPPGYAAEPGVGSLFKADSIRIRVSLGSLLNNQLAIHRVDILNPVLRIIQSRNGSLNTDYYLTKLTAGSNPSANAPQQQQTCHLQRLTLQNGVVLIDSRCARTQFAGISPTFQLTACNLTVTDLELPNRNRLVSPFNMSCFLGNGQQAKITVAGSLTAGTDALSFTAHSRIDHLFLPDYNFLAPQSALVVAGGTAGADSDLRCNNNYLQSEHHVSITGLKLKPRHGKLTDGLNGILLGAPATLFIKALEDRKGTFNFDFSLNGHLNDFKINLKRKVITAIQQAIRSKLGLDRITGGIRGGIQKVGDSLKTVFGKLFRKKK